MAQQIAFFANDADMLSFGTFAEKEGFYAIPDILATDEIPEPESPAEYFVDFADEWFFYLMHKRFAVVEAFYRELANDPTRAKLLSQASPVIQFSPSKREGDDLRQGRIFFDCDRKDPRYRDAHDSYEVLAHFLRNWPISVSGRYRIGPKSALEVLSGKLTLNGGTESVAGPTAGWHCFPPGVTLR